MSIRIENYLLPLVTAQVPPGQNQNPSNWLPQGQLPPQPPSALDDAKNRRMGELPAVSRPYQGAPQTGPRYERPYDPNQPYLQYQTNPQARGFYNYPYMPRNVFDDASQRTVLPPSTQQFTQDAPGWAAPYNYPYNNQTGDRFFQPGQIQIFNNPETPVTLTESIPVGGYIQNTIPPSHLTTVTSGTDIPGTPLTSLPIYDPNHPARGSQPMLLTTERTTRDHQLQQATAYSLSHNIPQPNDPPLQFVLPPINQPTARVGSGTEKLQEIYYPETGETKYRIPPPKRGSISPAFFYGMDPFDPDHPQPFKFGDASFAGYFKPELKIEFETVEGIPSLVQNSSGNILIDQDNRNSLFIKPIFDFHVRNKFNPDITEYHGFWGLFPPFDFGFKGEIRAGYDGDRFTFTPRGFLHFTPASIRLGEDSKTDLFATLYGGFNQSSFRSNFFIPAQDSLGAIMGVRTEGLFPQSAFYFKIAREWDYPIDDVRSDVLEAGFTLGLQGFLDPRKIYRLKKDPVTKNPHLYRTLSDRALNHLVLPVVVPSERGLPILPSVPEPQPTDEYFWGVTSKVGAFVRSRSSKIPFDGTDYDIDEQRLGVFAQLYFGKDAFNDKDEKPTALTYLFGDSKILAEIAYNLGDASYFAPSIHYEKKFPIKGTNWKWYLKGSVSRDTLFERINGNVQGEPVTQYGFKIGLQI